MEDLIIDVGKIEQLQMINDVQELDNIFQKAKSCIVCGAIVQLAREELKGKFDVFEQFTTLPDLSNYRKAVYKYLKTTN